MLKRVLLLMLTAIMTVAAMSLVVTAEESTYWPVDAKVEKTEQRFQQLSVTDTGIQILPS